MRHTGLALIAAALARRIPAASAQQAAPVDPRDEACRQVVERSRMTEDGQRLLQRLMRATETPALMDRLVHVANGLGGGDVISGLSRMLETLERAEKPGTPLQQQPGRRPSLHPAESQRVRTVAEEAEHLAVLPVPHAHLDGHRPWRLVPLDVPG